MGTNYVQHSFFVGAVLTSRIITITTAGAQQLTLLSSGVILVNLQNLGAVANVTVGGSSMLMGSGDTVFVFANREFYPVSDNFTTYVRADSIAADIALTEYGVV